VFQNINFFNNNKNVNNNKNLQIKQLFILYKFYLKLSKNKANLSFKDFFVSLRFFNSNFKHVSDSKTLLFLILVFLNKTNSVIFFNKLNTNHSYLFFGKNILNYYSNSNNEIIFNKFFFF
jgi:hypothetical protein